MNSLLFAAWAGPPEEAHARWREWRESVDVMQIGASGCFLLPLLRPRLEEWLAGDAAAPLLLGICKQAWSRNQRYLGYLRTLWRALTGRGIRPVVIGEAASALLVAEREVLPIASFDLMVPPDAVAGALEESARLGWQTTGPITRATSWIRMVNGSGEGWTLRWRRFFGAPDLASEVDAMPVRPAPAAWMGTVFTIPSPEWHLREILAEPRRPFWFCEARELGGEAPPARPDAPLSLSHVYRDYRLWRGQQRKNGAPPAFVPYLRARWGARSTAQLPVLAVRALVVYLRNVITCFP